MTPTTEWFETASRQAMGWAKRQMSGSDFAEDVVQDVWEASLPHLPHVANREGYVFIGIRHEAWRVTRQIRRRAEVPLEDAPSLELRGTSVEPTPHSGNFDLAAGLLQRVREFANGIYEEVKLQLAMRVMSDLERLIFTQRAKGFQYQQIETLAGRSAASLRQTACRCRADLPRRWAELAQTTLHGVRLS